MILQHHQYSTAKIAAGNIATHAVETGHDSTIMSLGSRPHALLSVACLDAISSISPHCKKRTKTHIQKAYEP